eukprot:1192634-Rhodomonas_salina.2
MPLSSRKGWGSEFSFGATHLKPPAPRSAPRTSQSDFEEHQGAATRPSTSPTLRSTSYKSCHSTSWDKSHRQQKAQANSCRVLRRGSLAELGRLGSERSTGND